MLQPSNGYRVYLVSCIHHWEYYDFCNINYYIEFYQLHSYVRFQCNIFYVVSLVFNHFTMWMITQHQESVKYLLTNWSTTHFVHIRNLLLKTSQLPFYGCMQIDVGKYPWFPLYKNPKMPNLRPIKHTHFASCKHVFVSTTSS